MSLPAPDSHRPAFTRRALTRRTILKGLGVSCALPWLETFARPASAAGAAAASPRRMACLFVPNGVNVADWTPSTTGYGFQLPPILQPLAGVRDELLVLTGLTHDKGRANGDGPGDHARSASVFLTGAQPRKTDGENIRSGVSVDQVAAQAIGKATRFASLELGCEPGRSAGNCDSGYSCAYSSSISWAGDASPLGKEVNPRLVFQRLFSSSDSQVADRAARQRSALRKSILDYVSDDARRLQSQLSRTDQRKLDEYLTGVREIERRIERAENEPIQTSQVDYPAPPGIPDDYREHLRLMCDMLVLAFQTDSTRIATFMFADAGSNRNYRLIDVPDGHHDLSHHGGDEAKLSRISRINRFHVEQFAYLLERLRSVQEADGTLLDNSMILYGSGLSDGNRHNHENLPILLAGRGGGTIDPGRHLVFPTETPLNNLYLSMLDRVGAPVDFIGDSTGHLPSLTI